MPGTKANYTESISPLCHTAAPRALIYPPTHEITTADKTRGMPSKGAYIYETFGKQMDKSNIFEAKRPKPLEKLMSEDMNLTIFSYMRLVMYFSAPSYEKMKYHVRVLTGLIKR